MTMRRLAAALATTLAPALAMAWPAMGCPLASMQQATGRQQALAAFREIVAAGAECSGLQRDWAAREVAAFHIDAAQTLLNNAGAPAAALLLLNQGLGYAPVWQGLALRGDLRQRHPGADGTPDFAGASEDYQAALNVIEAGDPQADPVPTALIASIWRKAEQTRMLAGRIVSSPPTRSGAPGGLSMAQVRSFVPVGVAVPVQFVFQRAEPTPAGAQAAEELAKMLDQAGRPMVVLIGHTDPVGTDAYNMDLSRRRADAVRQYLIQRGYPAQRVRIEGHGMRDPVRIEDADGYTVEQVHQILRRVEVRRQ